MNQVPCFQNFFKDRCMSIREFYYSPLNCMSLILQLFMAGIKCFLKYEK